MSSTTSRALSDALRRSLRDSSVRKSRRLHSTGIFLDAEQFRESLRRNASSDLASDTVDRLVRQGGGQLLTYGLVNAPGRVLRAMFGRSGRPSKRHEYYLPADVYQRLRRTTR